MEVVYDKVMRRLINVEKLLGIIDEKPKMVEDLENNLNILRTELFLKVAECENHVKETKNEQSVAERRAKELKDLVNMV